jgi:hypothetical protein
MAKRVADIVVETLQAAGVKHCWGVPGDTLPSGAATSSGCTSDTRRLPASLPGRRSFDASSRRHRGQGGR